MDPLRDRSERSDNHQNDNGDQEQNRELIEVTIEDMTAGIAPGTEVEHEPVAEAVVDEQQHHQTKLRVHPARTHVVLGIEADQPEAQKDREDCRRRPYSIDQLALHDDEAVTACLIFRHGVVDEQPWQVEDGRKPAHDGHDMKRLDPQHMAPLP